jgi:hypothetical protein
MEIILDKQNLRISRTFWLATMFHHPNYQKEIYEKKVSLNQPIIYNKQAINESNNIL